MVSFLRGFYFILKDYTLDYSLNGLMEYGLISMCFFLLDFSRFTTGIWCNVYVVSSEVLWIIHWDMVSFLCFWRLIWSHFYVFSTGF